MVGFREDNEIKHIVTALRNHYDEVASEMQYLDIEDQEASEAVLIEIRDIIQKIEFEFPWFKINGKYWASTED